MPDVLRLEYIPLSQVARWRRNPKKHDLAAIADSISFIYPDCRPAFIGTFEAMQDRAVDGFGHPSLHIEAPFLELTKADIVRAGHQLGVPFAETWSCYKGGDAHCGTCGTCVERREAFRLAGVDDPTTYEE